MIFYSPHVLYVYFSNSVSVVVVFERKVCFERVRLSKGPMGVTSVFRLLSEKRVFVQFAKMGEICLFEFQAGDVSNFQPVSKCQSHFKIKVSPFPTFIGHFSCVVHSWRFLRAAPSRNAENS